MQDYEIVESENGNIVIIPEGVEEIDNQAFQGRSDIVEIRLPSTLKKINKGAFTYCENLKKINLPNSIESIGNLAFYNCLGLEEIVLPEKLKTIENETFARCENLKLIKFPKELTEIKSSSFKDCFSLKEIECPEALTRIGTSAFSNCKNLENIKFSSNLESIAESSFLNCLSLKELNLPESLVEISDNAFAYCKSLKNVNFPKDLKFISGFCFYNCSSLENIVLPEGLESIGKDAFSNCFHLKNLNIPSTLNFIEKSIISNTALTEIHLPDGLEECTFDFFDRTNFNYFEKTDDGFMLSIKGSENSIPLNNLYLDYAFLSRNWENREILLKEQKNLDIASLYNNLLTRLDQPKVEEFIKAHNFTFFKQIMEQKKGHESSSYYYDNFSFFRALFNLGVFEIPKAYQGKVIDYSQKVSNFILELNRSPNFYANKLIAQMFNGSQLKGFKRDFTEFFMSNFDKLMLAETVRRGFVARCYNEFEEVQSTNTNNHGSQRQLKPTVEKFIDYFDEKKFSGVTEENRNIARTISPYFGEQSIFDEAVLIDFERTSEGVSNHILSTPLSEKDVFSNIDMYADESGKLCLEILSILAKIADNEFTFEWLAKNDPQNFILGKLCSCCAHINGMGYGIMHASIVDPNVQNLVIRNKQGKIIAKSTLYVNREEGYGVCNNVEVSNSIREPKQLENIYEKYVLGIKAFAERYNNEHPDKPLKQINVGMNLNDLDNILRKKNEKSNELLQAINYGIYGKQGAYYPGDSDYEQYIVWKDESNLSKLDGYNEGPKQM